MNKVMIILTAALLINACKPKEQETRRFEPGFKEYFDYHPGSYWVMEDQYTGITDSFYVDSRVYDPGEVPATNDGRKWESISIGIKQAGNQSELWKLYLYIAIANIKTSRANYDLLFTRDYPIPKTDRDSNYDSDYSLQYVGNKVIGMMSLDSVYRAREKDIAHGAYDDTVYFNRQQGFVEFAQHSGTENHRWLLKRSNIIR